MAHRFVLKPDGCEKIARCSNNIVPQGYMCKCVNADTRDIVSVHRENKNILVYVNVYLNKHDSRRKHGFIYSHALSNC